MWLYWNKQIEEQWASWNKQMEEQLVSWNKKLLMILSQIQLLNLGLQLLPELFEMLLDRC